MSNPDLMQRFKAADCAQNQVVALCFSLYDSEFYSVVSKPVVLTSHTSPYDHTADHAGLILTAKTPPALTQSQWIDHKVGYLWLQ
jgi:hypothetical protein